MTTTSTVAEDTGVQTVVNGAATSWEPALAPSGAGVVVTRWPSGRLTAAAHSVDLRGRVSQVEFGVTPDEARTLAAVFTAAAASCGAA